MRSGWESEVSVGLAVQKTMRISSSMQSRQPGMVHSETWRLKATDNCWPLSARRFLDQRTQPTAWRAVQRPHIDTLCSTHAQCVHGCRVSCRLQPPHTSPNGWARHWMAWQPRMTRMFEAKQVGCHHVMCTLRSAAMSIPRLNTTIWRAQQSMASLAVNAGPDKQAVCVCLLGAVFPSAVTPKQAVPLRTADSAHSC